MSVDEHVVLSVKGCALSDTTSFCFSSILLTFPHFFFFFLFALLNGVDESGVDEWISHAEITGACDFTAELFPLACKCNNTV